MQKKNGNRGYQQLRVWQDAIALYVETCRLFKPRAFEMKRLVGQAIASADSVHGISPRVIVADRFENTSNTFISL
jgi:hypothetical protein